MESKFNDFEDVIKTINLASNYNIKISVSRINGSDDNHAKIIEDNVNRLFELRQKHAIAYYELTPDAIREAVLENIRHIDDSIKQILGIK